MTAAAAEEFNELESVDIAAENTAARVTPTTPTGRQSTMNLANTSSLLANVVAGGFPWKKQARPTPNSRNNANCTNDKTAQPQGQARLFPAAGGKISLDHQLIGAVRPQGEENAADQARPEGIGPGGIEGEIEQPELVVFSTEAAKLRPPARQLVENHRRRQYGADHVNHELNAVVPDDRFHAARESIDDRGDSNHDNADGQVQAHDFLKNERGQIQTQPVGQISGDEKQQRGRLLRCPAEPAMEHLVRGKELAAEVMRQKQHDDHEAADNQSERQLQKQQITALRIEGDPRHAQERDGARFRGHDREQHPPPVDVPAAEQIIGDIALPAPNPEPE